VDKILCGACDLGVRYKLLGTSYVLPCFLVLYYSVLMGNNEIPYLLTVIVGIEVYWNDSRSADLPTGYPWVIVYDNMGPQNLKL